MMAEAALMAEYRTPDHWWRCWAKMEREDVRVSRTGYPSRVPWYADPATRGHPQTGREEHTEDDLIGDLSESDEACAEIVGRAVRALEWHDLRQAWALHVRWWTRPYIGEEYEEARNRGWSLERLSELAQLGREWCDAYIERDGVDRHPTGGSIDMRGQ